MRNVFFFLSEGCDKKNKTMMYFEVELLCWVRYKSRIYILNFTFLTDPNVLTNTENKNKVAQLQHFVKPCKTHYLVPL